MGEQRMQVNSMWLRFYRITQMEHLKLTFEIITDGGRYKRFARKQTALVALAKLLLKLS